MQVQNLPIKDLGTKTVSTPDRNPNHLHPPSDISQKRYIEIFAKKIYEDFLVERAEFRGISRKEDMQIIGHLTWLLTVQLNELEEFLETYWTERMRQTWTEIVDEIDSLKS